MKKFSLIILSFYLSAISTLAQNYSVGTVNEFEGITESVSYVDGGGGYAITSTGSLHVLIIFAEFPDDNYDIYNTRWVKGSTPQNMNSWVDQTWSTNPT